MHKNFVVETQSLFKDKHNILKNTLNELKTTFGLNQKICVVENQLYCNDDINVTLYIEAYHCNETLDDS